MPEKILKLLKDRALKIEDLKTYFEDFKELVKTLNELEEEGFIFLDEKKLYRLIDGRNYFTASITYKNRHFFVKDELFKDPLDLCPLNKDEGLFHRTKRGRLDLLKITKRHNKYIYGLVIPKRRRYFFKSLDRSFENFRLEDIKLDIKEPTYIEAYISDYRKALCRFSKIIAKGDDPKALRAILLAKYHVPFNFPKSVLKEAEDLKPLERKREDYRSLLTVTIDGESAKDFDDAISVFKKRDNYELYVHIADVSAYVLKNSALDKEALRRGNSLYYANTVTPMLPGTLSDDLCSLRPSEDRLSLTVYMLIDKNGEVLDEKIEESLIRSNYRLTYRSVEDHIDQKEVFKDEKLSKMIFEAYELSLIIEKRRLKDGTIEFYDEESEFTYQNGKLIDLKAHKDLKSEKLIANFMIMANNTIAKRMYHLGLPLIYRNHPSPKKEELEDLVFVLHTLGYDFKGKIENIHSSQFGECLDYFKDEDTYALVNNLLLRAMSKALYESESSGHYGLSLEHYCHFTSPIRRYADLINHRMIRKYLFDHNFDDIDADNTLNDMIALRCNENERLSMDLERAMNKLEIATYMKDHLDEEYSGIITGVKAFGFFVKLDNTAEGLVSLNTHDDYYEYDEKLAILKSARHTFRLGDRVNVIVDKVDPQRPSIDFILKKEKQYAD